MCAQCGEKFNHRKKLYNSAQAQDYTEWAKDNITICPVCWKANQQAEEETRINKIVSELTKNIALSTLQGSEKQIAWAEKIRAKALSTVENKKPKQEFWEAVNKKISASWWIDNRDKLDNIYDFCRLLKGE